MSKDLKKHDKLEKKYMKNLLSNHEMFNEIYALKVKIFSDTAGRINLLKDSGIPIYSIWEYETLKVFIGENGEFTEYFTDSLLLRIRNSNYLKED